MVYSVNSVCAGVDLLSENITGFAGDPGCVLLERDAFINVTVINTDTRFAFEL